MKSTSLLIVLTFAGFCSHNVIAQSQEEIRSSLAYPLDDIEKAKSQVESYAPGKQIYFVDAASLDWLKRAMSMEKRMQWIKETNFWNAFGPETPAKKKMLFDSFDALKAAAAKKLPTFIPDQKLFVNKDNSEIELMKSQINNLNEVKKYHGVGLKQTNWVIAKDDYNFPVSRYKQGYLWLENSESHWAYPYCVLVNVNVIQDYAGGGTYGESYANFIVSEPCGCPK